MCIGMAHETYVAAVASHMDRCNCMACIDTM